jgi:hypothetical protein
VTSPICAQWNWLGDIKWRTLPIEPKSSARAASNAIGECMKRAPFPRRTTVMRVVNGSGSRIPAIVAAPSLYEPINRYKPIGPDIGRWPLRVFDG